MSPVVVGRAAHLAALDLCLEHIAGGQREVLLVSGEAGIGKSRMVAEACLRATNRGFRVLQGACLETDRALPYAPFIDMLRDTPEWVSPLVEVGAPIDFDSARRRVFGAYADTFRGLAAAQPLVVVLEDLHWSDDTSLELIRSLARELAASPVLLLLTFRSDEVQPSLRGLLAALDRERIGAELALQPLEPTDIAAMLRAIFDLDRPPRPDFLDLVARLSEGNPFFIEEILRSLIASGGIFFAAGRWDRKPIAELHVPRSVEQAVQQRSARLSPAAAEVLRLAAVVGRRFGFGLLQALSGLDERELIEALKELLAASLIVEESAEQFAFRHALTREAVYGGLLARERRTLHRHVAELIESLHADEQTALDDHLELAHHFFEAALWDRALDAGVRAGERALEVYAPRVAVDQLTAALDAADHLRVRPASVHHARGLAYEMLGDFEASRRDLETALEIATAQADDALSSRISLDLGLLWAGRDYARTGEYVQQSLDAARRTGDKASVGHSLNRVGNWHMNVQRIDDALVCHREAFALFEALGDQRGMAESLDLLGVTSQAVVDPLRAIEYYTRAIPLLREIDDRQRLVNAMVLRTCNHGAYTVDRVAPGVTVAPPGDADAALHMARDMGWRAGEAFVAWEWALYLGPRGEYALALELAESALAIAEEIDHRQWVAGALSTLSALHLDLLSLAEARRYAERALEQSRAIGSPLLARIAAAHLSSAAAADGDFSGAAAVLAAALDEHASVLTMGIRLCWYARAELALAQRTPQAVLDIAERLSAPPPDVQSELVSPRLTRLRGEALAALGQFELAETVLREARDTAERTAQVWQQWRASAAVGRLYLRQRRQAEADGAFAEARQVIERLAANVPKRLRDTFVSGATHGFPSSRRSQAERAEFGGLTAREREVAALLARGLSNKAIADDLVVGERTVETYVSSILNKLGFTSRAQIAAWSVQRGLARD